MSIRGTVARSGGALVAPLLAVTLLVGGGAAAQPGPTRSAESVTAAVIPVASVAARPSNGAVLVDRGRNGRGRLTIDNGTRQDAVVTLARGPRAVQAIYVRAGRSASVRAIADATYTIYVQHGDGWDGRTRSFNTVASNGRFVSPVTYRTVRGASSIRYTAITATLHPVPDGNARLAPVRADELPR